MTPQTIVETVDWFDGWMAHMNMGYFLDGDYGWSPDIDFSFGDP